MFPGVFFFILKGGIIMSNDFNSYFQQITDTFNSKIDELIGKTRKETRDDLDQFEKEIELIEQGYSAEEVLNMTKRK